MRAVWWWSVTSSTGYNCTCLDKDQPNLQETDPTTEVSLCAHDRVLDLICMDQVENVADKPFAC